MFYERVAFRRFDAARIDGRRIGVLPRGVITLPGMCTSGSQRVEQRTLELHPRVKVTTPYRPLYAGQRL